MPRTPQDRTRKRDRGGGEGTGVEAPNTPSKNKRDSVKSPKRPPELALRMSHGWTVTDGTFDPVPQDKRRKQDVPFPSYVNHTFRSRSALSSLQVCRDAPVKAPALDIACDHLWKSMPDEVRRYVHVPPPNGPDLWSTNEEQRKSMYEKMDEKTYHLPVDRMTGETEYRLYSDVKKRPWIIWPIWVEDQWGSDWITVIWYSEPLDGQSALFDQLLSYAIIDPRRSPMPDSSGRHPPIRGRLERVRQRLFDFWSRSNFNVQHARVMEVFCSPMPLYETSSGERCFHVVKSLISQIIDWFTSGMNFDHSTTITSMPQWVNPFQIRVEMTGINAWVLMASLDYDARITVESILPNTYTEVVCDGKKKFLHNYDLAGPYDEPPIASHDYLLPSGRDYNAPPGQKKPNTFWEYLY
ncbi:hypothetical protein F4802DRAFT_586461 [Xylaria palmicola]|nr:hypothetical protein F4802DRAFT_586461 [Xylaria palmicola]